MAEVQSTISETQIPVVVGLYGVSGSGKTYLLKELEKELGEDHYAFYDGSEIINQVVPGGLEHFKGMNEEVKLHWRQEAIFRIKSKSLSEKKVAIVAGHYMFWSETKKVGTVVCTEADKSTYTHILYLNVPEEVIESRRQGDVKRNRSPASRTHLRKWQDNEKTQLRQICCEYGILFTVISSESTQFSRIVALLQDFRAHSEELNLSRAKLKLEEIIAERGPSDLMLVMDADRTLASEDTGALFWKIASKKSSVTEDENALTKLFKSKLQYSYTAFRQAVLMYEETADNQEFEALCEEVAMSVTMYPEFVTFLRSVARNEHVGAVVVTCGLGRVWEIILDRNGLSGTVKVVGGGRIADGFIVSAEVKGDLVTHLQKLHKLPVCAFGDSPLDLDMLKKADKAFVVVGEKASRSTTMDTVLEKAIDGDGLQANQILLPTTAAPRLNITKLPLITFDQLKLLYIPKSGLQVHCATEKKAAKLLATSMRDAAVAGPPLREAHRRAGWYLAIEYLANIMGVEEAPIQHVLGHQVMGFQLLHEQQTMIVALMRGGEPMAYGVNDAFPHAMFFHANEATDIKADHVQGKRTIVLVDSVINTGKSIVKFVQHVRELSPNIRIIIVAGVVQAQCIDSGLTKGSLQQALARYSGLDLVALRLSDTKFTGSGTNDTGNRLFNTTHLD